MGFRSDRERKAFFAKLKGKPVAIGRSFRVRCPKCGSTNANVYESRSGTHIVGKFVCRDCGYKEKRIR